VLSVEHEHAVGTQKGIWRGRFETLAVTIMVLAACVLVYVALEDRAARRTQADGRKPRPVPKEAISLTGAATMGADDARVVIILFSDFQCPFCARFATETLPQLERAYLRTGKVRLVFRHLPLSSIHAFANQAAESAWCAGQQGRFWTLHDRFFQNPSQLDDTSIGLSVRAIGLDVGVFERCRGQRQAQAQLAEDAATAKRLGVTVTPTFLLGTRLTDGTVRAASWFTGAQPFEEFQKQLDKVLGRP
jgi:protein-disulfide isomerase